LCTHVGDIRAQQVNNTLLMCKQEARKPIGRERAIAKRKKPEAQDVVGGTMRSPG